MGIMSEEFKTIKVDGQYYMKLYDDKGNVPPEFAVLGDEGDFEKSMENLQNVGLVDIIEVKGVKYISVNEPDLPPKKKNVPYNVLR